MRGGDTMKDGLRTTTFWTAIVSGILLLLQAVLRFFGIEIAEERTAELVNAINVIITAASIGGILINPEKVETFKTISADTQAIKEEEK